MNKTHYTVMNRMTKNKIVHYFQNKGAKVHFNYMKVEDPELSEQTGDKEMIVSYFSDREIDFLICHNILEHEVWSDSIRRLSERP